MKKILLMQLPAPVEQALTEHLKDARCFEIVSVKEHVPDLAGYNPDLVIIGDAGFQVNAPGCPVLLLPCAQTCRLGDVLRRAGQMLAQPVLYIDDIAIGACVFRPQEKSIVNAEGLEIGLTDREVDLLAYLASRRGEPVRREELLKNIWRYQEGVDTHTLATHIYRLRQKIEISADAPRFLLTVEGGYCLHPSEREV